MTNEFSEGKWTQVTGPDEEFAKSGAVVASVPAPVLHARLHEPEFLVCRVTLEYRTLNQKTTPHEVAQHMLNALGDIDDAWADRTRIVEAYAVEEHEDTKTVEKENGAKTQVGSE